MPEQLAIRFWPETAISTIETKVNRFMLASLVSSGSFGNRKAE